MPISGIPEANTQTVIVRPMIPGARRCGGWSAASAWAATGRRASSANRYAPVATSIPTNTTPNDSRGMKSAS